MVYSVNPYFRPYVTTSEQDLLDGLNVEFINIHGWQTYYLPRIKKNAISMYDTSDVDSFEDAYPLPVYLENAQVFKGDREFISKFSGGYEIRDQIILGIAKTTFLQEIGVQHNMTRPQEGDIVFFPFNNRIFQIKYVDKFETLFQLGVAPYVWRVTCELFEYSNEILNTGITEIDSIQTAYSTNLFDNAMKDTDNYILKFENGDTWMIDEYDLQNIDPLSDNKDVQDITANTVQVITTSDPFEELGSDKL